MINPRWRRPPFWISSIAHNSFTIAHICTKFGNCIAFEVLHTCMLKYWTKIKSKMSVAAIFDFCTNSNNSAADWHSCMKLCSNIEGCYRKWDIWPKLPKIINSRWRQPPSWIWHVYYVGGPTCMHAKILTKNKIQDVGGRHLRFLHKQQ